MNKRIITLMLVASMTLAACPIAYADNSVASEGNVKAVSSSETNKEMVPVKVIFRDGNVKISEARVIVSEDATTIPATDLKAPNGYKIVSVGTITSRGTCFVAVEKIEEVKPEAPKSRLVRVEYKNVAGAIVATERVNVEYGKLAMTVTAPEGYNLFDTNNVVSIDDETKTVEVLVVKEEVKPETETRLVTVNYKTSTGVDKGQEKIKVEKDATTISATDLKNVPEGYKVVGEVKINGRFAKAIVEPIENEIVAAPVENELTGIAKFFASVRAIFIRFLGR